MVLPQVTGGWDGVFIVAIVANPVAATMAMVVIKPLRRRMMARPAPAALPTRVPPMGVIAGEASR